MIDTTGITQTKTLATALAADLVLYLDQHGIKSTVREHPLGFALDTSEGSIVVTLSEQDIAGWGDTLRLDTLLGQWPSRTAHYAQFTR